MSDNKTFAIIVIAILIFGSLGAYLENSNSTPCKSLVEQRNRCLIFNDSNEVKRIDSLLIKLNCGSNK